MSSRIENYLGFPMGVSGRGAHPAGDHPGREVRGQPHRPLHRRLPRQRAGHLVVRLSDGTEVAGRAVIAATGASYRRLGAARLGDFEGNGVYYAATEMEARLCGPSPVVVVGGGNSAGQAALFLSQVGCAVTLVIRGSGSRQGHVALSGRPGRGRPPHHPPDAHDRHRPGRGRDAAVRASSRTPEARRSQPCAGLFSFIGADPSSGWLDGCAALDERAFVLTDLSLGAERLGQEWEALDRSPLPFETSHPGLFAVGDLRSGSMKRVASAVGEGSASVRSVHQYLAF